MTTSVKSRIAAFGAPEESVLPLDAPCPENIAYLDLMRGVSLRWDRKEAIKPEAVVEYEGRPLLYVIDNALLSGSTEATNRMLDTVRSKLACRGEPAWLAVVEPGQLSVYGLLVGKKSLPPIVIRSDEERASTFIQDLALGGADATFGEASNQSRASSEYFHALLLKLITQVCSLLIKSTLLADKRDDVLSLVGRALFARFLVDRGLLSDKTCPAIEGGPLSCLSNAKNAAATCEWLDKTFNGELLPLADHEYQDYFAVIEKEDPDVFKHLSLVMYRAPDGQMSFDEAWGGIDFAHVPIGLLSEVYEKFAHENGPLYKGVKHAKLESIHYTPRSVAKFMLDEAFAGLKTASPDTARVLDPTVGCGVFLVLAYRRLVAERWKLTGKRPARKELRNILYAQICGFDINDSALKLAALSLYLTALELDPVVGSVSGMRFRKPLQGTILVLARGDHEPHPNPSVLGSIGNAISERFNGSFDIVAGNPPWTSWKTDGPKLSAAAEQIVREIGVDRWEGAGLPAPDFVRAYRNPDCLPDLPIIWRSMQWAKPGAVIALALHARLLFRRSKTGIEARDALFRSVRVTGILNGTALRKTKVWPNVTAPWCLFFAQNVIPEEDQAFVFVSPEFDGELNVRRGFMRIDYESAQPVRIDRLIESPRLLRTLFRGTGLDTDLMRRIDAMGLPTVGGYWADLGLPSGQGYQIASQKHSALHLVGLPDLRKEWAPRFKLNTDDLPAFDLYSLHRPKDKAIYDFPLLLLPEAIQLDRDRGCGLLAFERVVYNESFYGYSASRLPSGHAQKLVRYLHVLTASQLFHYHALLTSGKFGVERESLLKADVDAFPMVPLENLDSKVVADVVRTSKAIERGDCPWDKVDGLVAEIYGLSEPDRALVRDTLRVQSPDPSGVREAIRQPTPAELDCFEQSLQEALTSSFEPAGVSVQVNTRGKQRGVWQFIDITFGGQTSWQPDASWVRELADNSGVSRIVMHPHPGHLSVGQLNQYRYWTESRARLLALHIVQDRSDDLLAEIQNQ